MPYGQVIVPTADKLPASKRRARDLLARQEHAAKALRALADLENVDDDSDDGMGDEGLIFDEMWVCRSHARTDRVLPGGRRGVGRGADP